MAFGYGLLGALLLLLPGFAFVQGLKFGEASDFLSPRPDPPNSNITIFMVVLGAVVVHTVGSLAFTLNEAIASWYPLVRLGFDPNPYKAFLSSKNAEHLSSLAIASDLGYIMALTVGTFFAAEFASSRGKITTKTYPQRFGWLQPIVEQVQNGSHLAIGFVRTTSAHSGTWIGYDGLIRRLAMDDDNAITMVVLEQCDRFLVAIEDGEIKRIDSQSEQIAMMQFKDSQIADFAIELFEFPDLDDDEEGEAMAG